MLTPTNAGLVVIVEDDAGMRRSIERYVCARGYAFASFASAEDFLRSALDDSAFGLVLDINLPGMSGIDLARCLLDRKTRLPVVFITAFDDAATRAEAVAVGCVDFLQKPFEAARLIEALESGRKL